METSREGRPARLGRRTVIRLGGGLLAAPLVLRYARAAGNPTVVNSIRSLTNPYHATWNRGGAAFRQGSGRRLRDPGDRGQQREGRL